MPSTTRRRALQSAAAALGLLAGCNGERSSGATATASNDGPPSDALTDPPQVALRSPDPRPVVTEDGTDTDSGTPAEHFWRHTLVADAATADSLAFADVDGADEARAFLADTDFDAETVFVEQRTVAECFELSLCWVSWSETRVETSYVQSYRPADVACEVDARDVTARLLRLPVVLDPDDVHEFGSGTRGSGRCRTPHDEEVRE